MHHIALHPIHSRLNLHYPKSTAFSHHRPHLLQKKYYFHRTPFINLLPHSPLPPHDESLPLPTTPTTFSGSHGLTQTSLHHLTTSSYVTYLTKVPTRTLFFPHHLQFRPLLKVLPTSHLQKFTPHDYLDDLSKKSPKKYHPHNLTQQSQKEYHLYNLPQHTHIPPHNAPSLQQHDHHSHHNRWHDSSYRR